MAENRNRSTLSPASSPCTLRRTISNESVGRNDDGLPPLLFVIQTSPKAPRRLLPDRSYTSESVDSSFIPEEADNTADLCDLYRQIWSEQVSPLSTQESLSRSSPSRGVKRTVSQTLSPDKDGDLFEEDDDVDGDCMSIFSLDESILEELDAAFSDDELDCSNHVFQQRRQQTRVPPSTLPMVEGLEMLQRESNIVVEDDDEDDMGSLASSVDTMYSFDAEFELM